MSMAFEITIIGLTVVGIVATGVFNLAELWFEHHNKNKHNDQEMHLIQIKNYMKTASETSSDEHIEQDK